MGIINATPDSFYVGQLDKSMAEVLQLAERMLQDGASILDIGGQSTRPGSTKLTAETESSRVLPIIEAISKRFPEAILSVDTFYSKVASEAIAAGAHIVNDISSGTLDVEMIPTVAALKNVAYVCMHMKGTPQDMQQQATYDDLVKGVLDYFIKKVEACRVAGIKDVIIDPGFGFAKTIEHNFSLLKELSALQMLNRPLLVGLSRKATVYKTLGITAAEALNGTTSLNTIALLNGANILRVHDVKEAMETIKLVEAYQK